MAGMLNGRTSARRQRKFVARRRHPLAQTLQQPRALRLEGRVVRQVALFIQVFIQIEEQPRLAGQAGVLPAVSSCAVTPINLSQNETSARWRTRSTDSC
jgi:hypothetical protein